MAKVTLPSPPSNAEDIPLHESAQVKARYEIMRLTDSLVLQAQVLAHKEKEYKVIDRHIDRALEVIGQERARESNKRQLTVGLISTFMGVALGSSVSAAVSSPPNSILTLLCALAAMALLLLIFGIGWSMK
jgi:hypothetical protein